jgi:hypothetical protein
MMIWLQHVGGRLNRKVGDFISISETEVKMRMYVYRKTPGRDIRFIGGLARIKATFRSKATTVISRILLCLSGRQFN